MIFGIRNISQFFFIVSLVSLLNIQMTLELETIEANAHHEQDRVLSFEQVKKFKDNPCYILIDVREPSELVEQGSIPGSINIPLNDLENVLTKVSADDFKKIYGREKPDKNFEIIFSCRSGRRSQLAQEKAIALGYKHVNNYSGSWLDWEKHTKASN